jgi:hypothetical protein
VRAQAFREGPLRSAVEAARRRSYGGDEKSLCDRSGMAATLPDRYGEIRADPFARFGERAGPEGDGAPQIDECDGGNGDDVASALCTPSRANRAGAPVVLIDSTAGHLRSSQPVARFSSDAPYLRRRAVALNTTSERDAHVRDCWGR